jgi:WXG100 family type VII secretion target
MANAPVKGVVKLDTSGFESACKSFENGTKEFDDLVERFRNASEALLQSWDGKGGNEFEYQYNLLKGKLKDISEDLYEIYEALLEAEVAYSEADDEMAKAIKYSV